MRNCEFENLIDDYLLGRLSEPDREKFEEHYFNCPDCFQEMAQRDELMSVIKTKGYELFHDELLAEEPRRIPWYESALSYFTPRQWAVAAASAALLLVVIFGVLPSLKTTAPQFFINEDLVRGESITLISPVIDINIVPYQFKWKSHGENVEYKIYLYNEKLLWTTTTKENSIILPDEVRKMMTSDEQYSWQVKAFSAEGSLIAVSSRVQFKVVSYK